jgi:hypothetical protein
MSETAFVVPHWNNYPLLAQCLESLFAQTATDFAVLVVDNGSNDGSPELVARDFPRAEVVRLGRNLGFAAAANRGIAASRSPYLAFVNNDVRLAPDWLEKMLRGLKGDPALGACACKLLMARSVAPAWSVKRELDGSREAFASHSSDQSGRRSVQRELDGSSESPRLAGAGNLVLKSGFGRDRGYGEEDHGQYDRREMVFWASGGACLIPRRLFDEIGPWDESFFAYFEDIDLGLRAHLKGYRCRYLPEAVGWHRGAATGKTVPRLGASLRFRNALTIALKDFPAPLLARNLGYVLFAHLRALAFLTRKGYFREAVRSELFLAGNLPRIMAERKKIQRSRTVPVSEIAALLSPEDFSAAAVRGWFSGLSK